MSANDFAQKVAEYRKALAAFLVPGLSALGVALADGEGVTAGEWIAVAIAALGSSGVVALVPNRERRRLNWSDVPHRRVED